MPLADLPMVVFAQGQKALKGGTKHEQRHGDPPEPNPVVRRERIGDKSAAGDGDGGMQRIMHHTVGNEVFFR